MRFAAASAAARAGYAFGAVRPNVTQAYPATPPQAPRPEDPVAADAPARSFLTLASSLMAAK
jgi:hypothetical protein